MRVLVGAVLPSLFVPLQPATRHSAFDRPNRTIDDFCRFFIGKAAGSNQDKRLALLIGQSLKGARDVGQVRRRGLALRIGMEIGGFLAVPRLLAPGAAALGIKLISQDGLPK